ncbi:hypothetical protein M5689_004023 [Euphorbia peplus]|nr:hypothetical protein M5689_004023 [Euphorbia peplus]
MITLFIIFAPSSYCQDDLYYDSCIKPFHCGSLTNISYPFWNDISNDRSEVCGILDFHLQCMDESDLPIITIQDQDFLILSVDQSRKEMAIAHMDLWNGPCPDPTTFFKLTLDNTPFSFAPDFHARFSNISLFYDCTDLSHSSQRFVCSVNGEESYSLYGYDELLSEGWMQESSKCDIKVEIPVPKTSLWYRGLNDLGRVLRQGFNVSYKHDGNCVSCREGYDVLYEHDGNCVSCRESGVHAGPI